MPKVKFIKNKKGERVSLVLDIKDYEKLMEELEELEDIRAYDEAKQSGEPVVPSEQIAKRIRQSHK
jgi:hypothetical protein